MAMRLRLEASPVGVRHGLAKAVPFLEQCRGICADTAELVLAEVLNNIVEHGGEGVQRGGVAVRLVQRCNHVRVTVVDKGRAVPGEVMENVAMPRGKGGDLPEGGFGWALIFLGTEDLRYRRWHGHNILRFRLAARKSM